MAKYRICASVRASKYIGEVEAGSEEEAIEKGAALDGAHISLCHQCSGEMDDPEVDEIFAEEI
jgi:hypothetical protein